MPPKGPEYELQSQIAELATILGWEHVAFRPLMSKRGWRTPGTGTMAKGWPDMTLVRARDRRLIFAELKSDRGKPSDDQERVLEVLRALEGDTWQPQQVHDHGETKWSAFGHLKIEVFVWRPRDWPVIEATLR